jgi:hypothetical protein
MAMDNQEETKMRRFVLAVAGLAFLGPLSLPAPAAAQVSASRLYKLCLMEDPDCLLTLHTVYALALAKLANTPERIGPMCRPHHEGRSVSDQELFYYYMHALQTDEGYLSRMSAIGAMTVIIDPCSRP